MNLLLIEDNIEIAASVGEYLESCGHLMDFAYDGKTGLNAARAGQYDVLIVDIGLPRMDGLTLCEELRRTHQVPVPILILTARDTLDDMAKGFSAGGDDYMVKPFAMRELEIRIQALNRRYRRDTEARVLTVGALSFNLDTQQVEREGIPVLLQPMPRKILDVLMRHPGQVVSKQYLELELWPDGAPGPDVLRVHVHALRSAIDSAFDNPMLQTIHGTGYKLVNTDVHESE